MRWFRLRRARARAIRAARSWRRGPSAVVVPGPGGRGYSPRVAKRGAGRASEQGKTAFLAGVLLISLAALMLQIVQTRILSVLVWYYLAFFSISVAMLGMTAGAVWVHLRGARLEADGLASALANAASAAALAMPFSLAVQFSLVTVLTLSLTTLVSWSLLLGAMTVPYFFVGIAVSLALTRSPFPVSQVYAVDLIGAALGCVA